MSTLTAGHDPKGAGDGRAAIEKGARIALRYALDRAEGPGEAAAYLHGYLCRQGRIASDLAQGSTAYGPDFWSGYEARVRELLATLEPSEATGRDPVALAEELGIEIGEEEDDARG